MIARQNHTGDTSDRYPTGCLKSLCSLVNKDSTKLLAVKQAACRADKRRGDDTSLTEEVGIDAHLQLGGTTLQSFQFLMIPFVASLAMGTELSDSLTNSPQQFIIGMCLETPFIGKRQHLIVNTRRITDP